MDLEYTLQRFALQLKNKPRTLCRVARVFQKIMKTLLDETHFPNAEARRPGPNPNCPDADILTVAWLLEYIGEDSENSGYQRLKAELKTVFPSLPERSRFRRHLSTASEVIRRALTHYLPKADVFIVDSFPIPICDFKRANASKSDLKWADATGTLATYGNCATKGLGTFFGFRGTLITTANGVPIDFGITSADRDDRDILPCLPNAVSIGLFLAIKVNLSTTSGGTHRTEATLLLPTLRKNQKQQYPQRFRKLQVRMRRRIETTIGQLRNVSY